MSIRHVVLAGDSIFDNDSYVLGEPGVIEQLRRALPVGWSASKVAVDGDCIADVRAQVASLPTNATDLIVSVGGNDALGHADLLQQVRSFDDLTTLLARPLAAFQTAYREMLALVSAKGLEVRCCTIYRAIPFEDSHWRRYVPFALDRFNQVIADEAARRGAPLIRLEAVCTEPEDFSSVSPIEPSSRGGQKIVDALLASLKP